MADFAKAVIGLMAIAGASLLGAYGSARSTYQPQPPVPGIADLTCWILQLNDPLALGLVLLTTITTGLSIWQAITSLTKKDVSEVVISDGDLTRDEIKVGRDEILEAISKIESNRTVSPGIAIKTIIQAAKKGLLETDDLQKLHKLILRAVITEHNPPHEVIKEFERELSKEESSDIFVDSLRDMGGESRAEIVSERARTIESNQTELVEQYARLAAFTAIEEPFRAIGFYRKALALDKTNAKVANALGQLLLLYGTASEARACFEKAHLSATEPQDRVDIAYGLSIALLKEGNSEASKTVLSEALATSETGVLSDPFEPYWVHNLIALNLRLAWHEKLHGQRLREILFLEDCFTAHGRLEAIGHTCATGDQSRAEANECRGQLRLATGDTEGAVGDFQNSIEIHRSLVFKYPEYSIYKRGLGSAHRQMALLHSAKGELDKADIYLQEALEITLSLIQMYPSNKLYVRDELVIMLDQATIRINQDRLDEAVNILEKEENKLREALRKDRSNSESQRDLSVIIDRQGDIAKSEERANDALEHYKESFKIRNSLFNKDKNDTNIQRDVAVVSAKIGVIHINNNSVTEAKEYLSIAQDIYLDRLSIDPESADTKFDVYDVTQLIGEALLKAGLRNDALELLNDAQLMIDSLSSQHPELAVYANGARNLADRVARISAPIWQN